MNPQFNPYPVPPANPQNPSPQPNTPPNLQNQHNAPNPNALDTLSPDAALEQLSQNPVQFIRQMIASEALQHLADLKEQAEIRAALILARKAHPDFERFEPFILQEVAQLIQDDPDGIIDPWDTLFEKGVENFRAKFKDTLKNNPNLLEQATQQEQDKAMAHMEGAAPRKLPALPPAFSRQQIAAMSTEEFLRQEAAIEDAMKNGRIR